MFTGSVLLGGWATRRIYVGLDGEGTEINLFISPPSV